MALIKTPSTSALALLTAMLVVVATPCAFAQAGSGSSSSKAQRLEWPRTFTGQPDFAFTRDEAILEGRTRATRENEAMPMTPTLENLVADDTLLDPLRVNAPKQAEPVLDASGTIISGTDIPADSPRGQSLMERLMSQAVDLPAVAASQKPDLTEFSARLSATISSTVANWEPNSAGYDFQTVLNSLSLQAIVTSPVRYAVINQQRYTEGEIFRITVPLPVPDRDIIAAAKVQMPISSTLPPALMTEYQTVYTNILAGFNAKRSQNPSLGQQTLVLPVRITGITPRQVLLEMGGKPYAIGIRYAY